MNFTDSKRSPQKKKLCLAVSGAACLAALVAVAIYFAVAESTKSQAPGGQGQGQIRPHDSSGRRFRYSAVTTDTNICSSIGVDMMASGGSAVDAAISTFLCQCLINPHSCGIGGGHVATIYEAPRNTSAKELMTVLARERAPLAANETMFVNKTGASTFGGLAVAVPGEIAGFYAAWQRYGRRPWKDLFAPSIRLCKEGQRVERDLARAIGLNEQIIRNDQNLREIYVHATNDSLLKQGDLLFNTKLADTLIKIAENPESFYNGSLAEDIISDLQEYGSIITREDLEWYWSNASDWILAPPVHVSLRNRALDLYSVQPPASGPILHFILNILDGYNFTSDSIDNIYKKTLTYHRIAESFKFAYAKRSQLGDRNYVDVTELVANLTSRDYADAIRLEIDDVMTHDIEYYGPSFEIRQDQGTAHMNVLAADGAAVSLTGTINTRFGSKVRGRLTGIIFNNEMDDFSTPGTINAFGVPASPSNYIVPGKMPMSSMAPLIALKEGQPVYLSGASGGTRITTSIAFIALNSLWLGVDLKDATDLGRIHHQLAPNHIEHEPWLHQELLEELKTKDHSTFRLDVYNSVCGSIRNFCSEREKDWDFRDGPPPTCVHAVSDGRKGGSPDGF